MFNLKISWIKLAIKYVILYKSLIVFFKIVTSSSVNEFNVINFSISLLIELFQHNSMFR